MIFILLTIQDLFFCENGFETNGSTCVCNLMLSSDSSHCVKTCAEANEAEIDGKCVQIKRKTAKCDGSLGFVLYESKCKNCWDSQQIAVDGECFTCPESRSKFQDGKCVCNYNSYVFFGTQCVDCIIAGQTSSQDSPKCIPCPNNQIFSEITNKCDKCLDGTTFNATINLCVCNQAGYALIKEYILQNGQLILIQKCYNCWKDGQEVSSNFQRCVPYCPSNQSFFSHSNQCDECGIGSYYYFHSETVGGICECDQKKGFTGPRNSICINCFDQLMIVQNGECSDCQSGKKYNKHSENDFDKCVSCGNDQKTIIDGKQCECNEQQGFAGNPANCQYCWVQNKLVVNGQCVSCKSGTKFVVVGDIRLCVPCNSLIGEANIAGVCTNCWSQMKIVNQNGDGCIICAAGLGFNPASDICEQCPTGSNPLERGQCVCDQSLGFTGLDGFACTDCFEENLTAVGNACTPCPSKTTFSVDKCVCDESKGFVGDASSCSDCWKQNMVVFENQCQDCQINYGFSKLSNKCILCNDTQRIIISKLCVCNELNGFGGLNPLQCDNCWSQNQIIKDNQCSDCLGLYKFNKVTNECVLCTQSQQFILEKLCLCNYQAGYVGINPLSCTNCWEYKMEIQQESCQPCQGEMLFNSASHLCISCSAIGQLQDNKICICDESEGFVGDNPSQCINCWKDTVMGGGIAFSCLLCEQLYIKIFCHFQCG
ncbi:VSP [Hexamita inflata]|uniref:VSP n=1 Tax=Hexamita inflata TaxID=28002 RepID=A0AA86Q4N4_9EUKA|nr:VSP [Hexamita inflata]